MNCTSTAGAVAGIVDQPIQVVTRTSGEGVALTGTGIVSGMGKGLVGVVTKPLGGAAELVSQAGQGICK